MDQRVEKIQQLMRDNLHKEICLSKLAESVNLSVWRLSHIFTSDVGMGPIKYLRLLRMDQARHLLETSYLSIKEIGFHVGLNDESHFVRDFKKVYGVAPSQYRTRFNATPSNGSGDKNNPSEVRRGMVKAAQMCVIVSLNLLSSTQLLGLASI